MPWQPLEPPAAPLEEWKQKTRILVDESLGAETAKYLKQQGFNAIFACDVGLAGKADDVVAAYAWRQGRMIWTHDTDFLQDRILPEHRNPGVVILPGGSGDQVEMATGLFVATSLFGQGPKIWHKTKSTISPTGEITIRRRDKSSGRMISLRYRFTKGSHPEEWVD